MTERKPRRFLPYQDEPEEGGEAGAARAAAAEGMGEELRRLRAKCRRCVLMIGWLVVCLLIRLSVPPNLCVNECVNDSDMKVRPPPYVI